MLIVGIPALLANSYPIAHGVSTMAIRKIVWIRFAASKASVRVMADIMRFWREWFVA